MRLRLRRGFWSVVFIVAALWGGGTAFGAPPAGHGDEILQYLNQTIDWYRRVAAVDQQPVTSEEVVYRETVRETSRQALQLAFGYAKAGAALLGMSGAGG